MMTGSSALNPEQWVSKYGDYLFSLACLKISNRDAAQDMVQEVFISAIKSRDSFRGESSEKTWLVAILKNKVIDYYRKQDVLRNATQYLTETDESFTSAFFQQHDGHWSRQAAPAQWAESADKSIEQSEFEQVVEQCIQRMPPTLRPVFIAKFIDDEKSETICKVYGISSSNYWVILHRAKVIIRACLEKNWFTNKAVQ